MAGFSPLLCTPVRVISPYMIRFWKFAASKRITSLSTSVQRRYTSPSSFDLTSALQRYKDLKRYFNWRLKAAYKRFNNIPDHSKVCGHHFVYFIERDGIYRMDKRQRLKPEKVLSLRQVSEQEENTRLDNKAEKQRWTVQRIRLSPRERHLAALLKNYSEELRCVVVRLGKRNCLSLDPPQSLFSLDNVFSFEWATDEVMFYTTLEGLRCHRVFRLDMTSSGNRIKCIYEETRSELFVEVSLSKDRQLLSINCNSRTASEVRFIDTTTSHLEPVLVQPLQPNLLYHVEHWSRWLIILANTGPGQEYQVLQAPLSEPSMDSWESLFVPGPGTVVKDMDVVGDHCVLVARTPASEVVLIVITLTNPKEVSTVQLPSWTCAIKIKTPYLADHSVLELLISSPVQSPVPYCLYPGRGLLLSGTEDGCKMQDSYTTKRLEACSEDGTSVPVTLFHKLNVEGLNQTPLLVHVYGAYGHDLDMDFSPEKMLLLEQGWALAYCHIRGGGERGLSWHRQACVEGKQRGVEDLRACLHHLFSLGVSSPSFTALAACSAGAVPVGALCNTHPHLMQAVTLEAPFLDVLGTMEDPNLSLKLEDREEWGDPIGNPTHKLTISSYCPLHNITPQCYPSILLTAYSGDARVPVAGVLKYTEKLNHAIHTHFAMKPKSEHESAPNIVLNIQSGANHSGPEDFDLMLEEEALKLAFLYKELGLNLPGRRRTRKKNR